LAFCCLSACAKTLCFSYACGNNRRKTSYVRVNGEEDEWLKSK
jgi:hypothetical protein